MRGMVVSSYAVRPIDYKWRLDAWGRHQYGLSKIYGLPDIARRLCGCSERTQLQQSIRPPVQPVGCGPDEFRAAHASLGYRPGVGQFRYQAGVRVGWRRHPINT